MIGNKDSGIEVIPYHKPTTTNSTLLADFCHLPHVVKNVPVGELTRLKTNCSDRAKYLQAESDSLGRLKACRYPYWSLRRAKNLIVQTSRQELLLFKNKQKSKELGHSPIVFSTLYSPQSSEITNIIRKYLPILSADEKMVDVLATPIKYVAKRACTIANIGSPGACQKQMLMLPRDYLLWFSTGVSTQSARPITMHRLAKHLSRPLNPLSHKINSFINCNT